MSLFKNRPLAFFCLIFIAIGAMIYTLGQEIKLILLLFFFLSASLCIVFGILRKKLRLKLIFGFLCCFFALLAVVSHLLLIDLRRERALDFEGERGVRMIVISEEYSSEHSGEYRVRIKEIDGRKVSIPSVAVCAFPSDISAGDELYARAVIYPAGAEILGFLRDADEGVYIHVAIYDGAECARLSAGNRNLEMILSNMRKAAADYMDVSLGEDTSALARGFLLGDKGGISADILRDFRRAGVSHLLAVSGLHISVIMGAIELILRRLGVGRGARCISLSLIAVFFLAMTGFSMSASRSVVMLLGVYFCYLFVKESDSVTALFASVAFIMMIFPHSVRDVGLWLSFLATLGILTVYLPLTEMLHRRRKAGFVHLCRHLLEKLFFAILLTFVCNVFICMVVWIVFGEISVISLISNIILSPLSSIFIIAAPIVLLICHVPFIGSLAVSALSLMGKGIAAICTFFSDIHGAVISFRYGFAGIIIVLMSLSLAVMLVINLKRKWTVIIPPLAAVAAFAVCLAGYNAIHVGELGTVYYSEGQNEMIVLCEGYSGAVCDISSGGYSFVKNAPTLAAENMATELGEYVLTHYHERHIATLERILANTLLRKIYLPYPDTEADAEIMTEIKDIAREYRVEVDIYNYGEKLSLLDGSFAAVLCQPAHDGSSHKVINVVIGNDQEVLSYIGLGADRDKVAHLTENSDYIIFGDHGGAARGKYRYDIDGDKLKIVLFAEDGLLEYADISFGEARVCAPHKDEKKVKFKFILR